MSYRIDILRKAQKQLEELPAGEYERVRDAIFQLAEEPRPVGCIKLSGREGWRIRIGRYRVIYLIEDTIKVVLVTDVGHRKDIY